MNEKGDIIFSIIAVGMFFVARHILRRIHKEKRDKILLIYSVFLFLVITLLLVIIQNEVVLNICKICLGIVSGVCAALAEKGQKKGDDEDEKET